jgi:hypothetical protein
LRTKLAVGIVVSRDGLSGMISWKPVAVECTMAEAEALACVLQDLCDEYLKVSRKEQVLLAEYRKIWKR